MNQETKITRLLELFKKLRGILASEDDKNWIRGIEAIIFDLSSQEAIVGNEDEVVRYVEYTYKGMCRGNGSFSDFYIWRDDFEERVSENEKLNNLKEKIWREFDR
ncbi:hypothetical protein [Aeromonas cavernicola]|uniref:Uncharacterized protein n=1 Tax=Aeromonas cavernicola TaxID=1006623 RepID=A0A2H9U2Y7_9GAMM|nr:hypothetical protein [Aeromonas cavernicola]PJG58426.1 hypothetical protein CUC53_12675 [Aeromonas cavernicola]